MRAKAPNVKSPSDFASCLVRHPTPPEASGRRHPGPQAPRRRAAAGPRFPRTGTTGDADRRASRCHLEPIEGVGRLRLHPDDPLATLRRFRLTYKKNPACRERDTPEVQAKRRRYRAKVRRIEAKRLVFVDETGVNTAMTPTHAWARRGERAEGSVPSAWGSTTVIAALGLDGVRAPLIFPGATDTQAFQTYVDQCWSRNSARGTWWSSTTSNPTSLGTWRSRSSVRGRLSCPCRHTARTTTRSRSCGRVQGTASPDHGADEGRLVQGSR